MTVLVGLPGLAWLRETPDVIALFLPNGELRITGNALSVAVEILLKKIEIEPMRREALIWFATEAGVPIGMAEYALDTLEGARCVRRIEGSNLPAKTDWVFWCRSGEEVQGERLATATVGSLCYEEDYDAICSAVALMGCKNRVEVMPASIVRGEAAELLGRVAATVDALLVFGLPYAHAFTRLLARDAVAANVLVLFAEVSGFVGRVGPAIFGRDLPCLDCLHQRHAANGGGPLSKSPDGLSTAGCVCMPRRPVAQENLRALTLQGAAMELCRILIRDAPQSFGGYLEMGWGGQAARRALYRVPGCIGCVEQRVERFPFHVTPLLD